MPSSSPAKPLTLYTVGHSTRPIKAFVELLKMFRIKQLVDVRTIPRSRHNPQFDTDQLSETLKAVSIRYVHMPQLGGLRHAHRDSPNTGWRNASFRGFGLHAAAGIPERPRQAFETRPPAADSHHVRRSRSMAMPSLAHCGCAPGARRSCRTYHEREMRRSSHTHAVCACRGIADYVSRRGGLVSGIRQRRVSDSFLHPAFSCQTTSATKAQAG